MCVSCGQELCKSCRGCHNSECERYIEPIETCEVVEPVPIVEDREYRNPVYV
jgi:hypothetical protein